MCLLDMLMSLQRKYASSEFLSQKDFQNIQSLRGKSTAAFVMDVQSLCLLLGLKNITFPTSSI